MGNPYKYVFVVCGSREHFEQLRLSTALLRRFSRLDFLVVTDSRKNEEALPKDGYEVIDVPTPPEWDPARTAIYLKTGLHRWLPPSGTYCYLDTDVLAVRPGVDNIFAHYTPPITFCTDHCRLSTFSPSAVHDAYFDHQQLKQQKLLELEQLFQQEEEAQLRAAGSDYHLIMGLRSAFNRKRPAHTRSLRQCWRKQPRVKALQSTSAALISKTVFQLMRLTVSLLPVGKKRREDLLERWHQLVFHSFLSYKHFLQEHGYSYDPTSKRWYDLNGRFIYEEDFIIRRLETATGFRWDAIRSAWFDEAGGKISELDSDLLRQRILEQFGVHITEPNWQHWNGGVFVFDHRSSDFLEQWHQWSRDILFHPQWKPRDQGTLAATAWHFGLERHPTLPVEFNLIADYYHPRLRYKGNLRFELDNRAGEISPCFLHIYHQWGNPTWPLWQDIMNLFEEKTAS